jgi:hypothetical protein
VSYLGSGGRLKKLKSKPLSRTHSKSAQKERDEIEQIIKRIDYCLGHARWQKAYTLASEAYQKFPHNRFAQSYFAALSGDCEEWAPKHRWRQYKELARRSLKSLVRRLHGLSDHTRHQIRNEYYWFSKNRRAQFRLGIEGVRKGDLGCYYSCGVAATTLAKENLLKGKIKLGLKWAKIGEEAWQNYFTAPKPFYSTYAWYALALGTQGRVKEMEHFLKRAARQAGRPDNYQEFAEVREDVKRILRRNPTLKASN